MRILRLLPERWQRFIREALKFGTVGGINTVVNFAVFNALALTVLADGQLKATVVAALVATTSSYFMNRHWTYRDRPKSAIRREYVLFFLFNLTGLAIEVGVLGLAKYGFGISGLLALNIVKIIGLVLGTIFRFWAYRTFVFRPAPATHPTTGTGPTTGAGTGPAARGPVPQQIQRDGQPPTSQSMQAPDSTAPLANQLDAELAAELDAKITAELDAEIAAATRPARR
ncbi:MULTISPECIES: GtrA family protein [unclassified Solwaraspora]|uniref:GtrA family protein n=1 Tax=unclassified Solwaraspora TaxID=2627926 RepID=UPI00248CA577|nr:MULTISPECIES: GtrA family protein [unclassified Solwaraspora]WBB97910.1 GtrA family protein [Solwaraspora sp. WMMA2059]WBC23531.1 GtrA family protein [Solwaraspora sp. WMMA2080]WJK34385.1 GtrA family protein [Solwaraspora sp. WMMA2065]